MELQKIKSGQVTNADVYMDGAQIAGRIASMEPDEIAYEMVEHKALGMVGQAELPGRQLKAIKATIKWIWLETAVLLKTATPNRSVTFTVEQFVDVFDATGLVIGQSYRVVSNYTVLFGAEEWAAMEAGDESMGYETPCSVVRLTVKSTETDQFVREFDLFAGINRVDGKDVWPKY